MRFASRISSRRSLLLDRRFRHFWAGQTISQFGDRITELALPLIAVATLNASAWQVATLTALVWTPNLFAMLLGSWVDRRTRKRRLMVCADLLRVAVLISLPTAYLLGGVSFAQLYTVAFLAGAGAVLFNTANPAFFVHLVPRESYIAANSKLSASRAAATVAGPALAGTLIQALTAPAAVMVDALSFLISALLVGRIPIAEPAVITQPYSETVWRRVRAGLRLLAGHPVLRAGLACSTTINFFTFLAGSGLIVLFASRVLAISPGIIGLALGLGSTGALLGAIVAPRVSRRIGVGPSIAVGAVLFPAPIAIVAAATGPVWWCATALGAAEFLSGIGVMLFDVNLNAVNMTVIPDLLRGRVAGAYSAINYGIRPVGALVGGALATVVGLRPTLLIAAVGGGLSLLWLLRSPMLASATWTRSSAQPIRDATSKSALRGLGSPVANDELTTAALAVQKDCSIAAFHLLGRRSKLVRVAGCSRPLATVRGDVR